MHGGEHSILLAVLTLLGFGLIFVLIFRKLGLGATLGYLVAGAIVGPQVLNLAGNAEVTLTFAEIGIILLLFIVGLELNPARLWRMRKAIFGVGLAQVALCGLALTGLILLVTGYPWTAALALGLPLALSSTAQVLPMLQSGGRLNTPLGERAFSILLFQDLSIIALITIIAALSVAPGAEEGLPGWQLALMSIAATIGLVLAGRFLLRPLFALIGRLGEREMFIVAGLTVVIGAAALMEALGLSAALGAFIAGVMLSDTPYRHELEADIEPFRSILLGLFFLSVGMMLDLGAIAENPGFVAGMALALISVKAAIIFGLGKLLGMDWRGALALGLLLSQGGEFGFVMFTQAQAGGLIDAEIASLFGAIVTLSMATTPFLMMLNDRIRKRDEERERDAPDGGGAHALVIGFGRFGQTVAEMLVTAEVPVTLIDRKVDQIDLAGEFGAKVWFGDGTRIDLLRQAGADEAKLLVFCIDGDQVTPELVAAVRGAFPQAAIMVRAFDRRTLMALAGSEVDHVQREVLESAIRMGRKALARMGLKSAGIDDTEAAFRHRDRDRLERQIDADDIMAGRDGFYADQMGPATN
ncbi:cation:proton antiporter [Alteriqipengyuania flavescens]|uniref:cation:proton antiporter domain-containing protein n=1 Tax=Alteriqipengyuania flavescens TaxID=3053610 RepID=UPI0025B4A08C|nr:cation:proton antiporter [Alteriqipengyuania flavescens]WJY19790.1 cation:proton antiporter [Alteriqipengyuania flavescens]WJY25732.1 cation:proton antiporter [Alteriqipengyuania flavescens]